MHDYRKFFIDGNWVESASSRDLDVINPATDQRTGVIRLGTAADVDAAVRAARAAFDTFSLTSREDRIAAMFCGSKKTWVSRLGIRVEKLSIRSPVRSRRELGGNQEQILEQSVL